MADRTGAHDRRHPTSSNQRASSISRYALRYAMLVATALVMPEVRTVGQFSEFTNLPRRAAGTGRQVGVPGFRMRALPMNEFT